jgi:hypothetical protein
MITAAMATMATVETAKTTRPFCLVVPMSKLAGLLLLRAPPQRAQLFPRRRLAHAFPSE